ncbi:MAG: tRNA (adenosine(37)-N6)-threonylcarbamoyltransferase complex dimerization subunit type 1 TsaB [Zoogloeaceae bacterium]|jgi:tRNA threonylcarbamoyladenosine biosynthesis protein TsaB|nr:tRNA (adenosine(37)-N6)-threonylcarbamoyltransferase complex dimerization subunit type 1 TsaB [Zoogloeaceae bacterium]
MSAGSRVKIRAMRILALETSTESGSCAFWQEGGVLVADCPPGRSHSETLIPLVQQLLAEAGCGFAALDAIAFGMGPGAFTGLRVACGVAQGMAAALDLPMLPVGSLEAMAWATGGERVLSLLDARMGEVYCGAFERDDARPVALTELAAQTPEAIVLPQGEGWLAAGNALRAYPQLAARFEGLPGWRCLPAILPHAKEVAELGALAFLRGEALDPALAAPRYVRDKVARTTAERLADRGHS